MVILFVSIVSITLVIYHAKSNTKHTIHQHPPKQKVCEKLIRNDTEYIVTTNNDNVEYITDDCSLHVIIDSNLRKKTIIFQGKKLILKYVSNSPHCELNIIGYGGIIEIDQSPINTVFKVNNIELISKLKTVEFSHGLFMFDSQFQMDDELIIKKHVILDDSLILIDTIKIEDCITARLTRNDISSDITINQKRGSTYIHCMENKINGVFLLDVPYLNCSVFEKCLLDDLKIKSTNLYKCNFNANIVRGLIQIHTVSANDLCFTFCEINNGFEVIACDINGIIIKNNNLSQVKGGNKTPNINQLCYMTLANDVCLENTGNIAYIDTSDIKKHIK